MSNILIHSSSSAPPESANEGSPAPNHNPKQKISRELLSTIFVIVSATVIAWALSLFVFQSYEVDGQSMTPTLQNKDRLIVSKLSKTVANISGSTFMPKRYQIIVFDVDEGYKHEGKRQLIKRVVGLPGDQVVIKDGVVTIYNDEHPNGFLPDKERLQKDIFYPAGENIDETVEDDEVFVLGDNRDNSTDSRVFGPIKTTAIVGILELRIYPFNKVEKF